MSIPSSASLATLLMVSLTFASNTQPPQTKSGGDAQPASERDPAEQLEPQARRAGGRFRT